MANNKSGKTALLLVDLQREFCGPGVGGSAFSQRVQNVVVPAASSLLRAARKSSSTEVCHVIVEGRTLDGRDMGIDYRECGISVPLGSPGAAPCDARLARRPNEIVLRKTTSSVFNSCSAEQLLRNLEISHLVVAGVMSDCCVEATVRHAADLGFWVTVVEDGCAALDAAAHKATMSALGGYGNVRILSAAAAAAELDAAPTQYTLNLSVLAARFAVVRLPPASRIPAWAARALDTADGGLVAIARTAAELSIVAPENSLESGKGSAPVAEQKFELGWRVLRVEGPLDFALVGILANLATKLAEAGVSIFAISTFDTDYILVKEDVLGKACAALEGAGHCVARPARL